MGVTCVVFFVDFGVIIFVIKKLSSSSSPPSPSQSSKLEEWPHKAMSPLHQTGWTMAVMMTTTIFNDDDDDDEVYDEHDAGHAHPNNTATNHERLGLHAKWAPM